MGIDRDYFNGPITFCCDECGDLLETRASIFEGALAKAKSRGWTAYKSGNDWNHSCSDCNKAARLAR